jgi:hypothetical protein
VAITYKVEWEKELRRRERLGITDLPEPLPHPDDIIIDMNEGTARVVGPATKEEKAEYDEFCVVDTTSRLRSMSCLNTARRFTIRNRSSALTRTSGDHGASSRSLTGGSGQGGDRIEHHVFLGGTQLGLRGLEHEAGQLAKLPRYAVRMLKQCL